MKKYSIDEIKKHNQPNNCWVIIDSKVYDMTQWLKFHSGGSDKIAQVCGQDATDYFAGSQPQTHAHSGFAKDKLKEFSIGELE